MYAYKTALNDAAFAVSHCALCARQKSVCKLWDVEFPPKGHAVPPAWLGYTSDEWLQFGEKWYEAIDGLLSIQIYLQNYFKADERVQKAEGDLAILQAKLDRSAPQSESAELALRSAEVWVRRVREWKTNLRLDLENDAVCFT